MRAEIIKLRQRINTTFVYVTHDQTEAMTLGDRIVIMKDGVVQQIGTPQEVFDNPANLFVAGFIGVPQMNFFDAKLRKEDGKYFVEIGGISLPVSDEKNAKLAANGVGSKDITLGVRPDHIVLMGEGEQMLHGKVEVSEMMGSSVHLHLNFQGQELIIIAQTMDFEGVHQQLFSYGQEIAFTFGGNVMHLFDKETGESLTF